MRFRHLAWIASIIIILVLSSALFDSASRFFGINTNQLPVSPQVVPQQTGPSTASPSPAPAAANAFSLPAASQPVAAAPLPRDQHWKAQTLLIEAGVAQGEAVRLSDRWNEEIEPLRSNSSGQVVAANQDLLEKLAFVLNRKRASVNELEVMGRKIQSLTKLLEDAASKSKPQALPTSAMMDIGKIHSEANASRREWDESLNDAKAIVLMATQKDIRTLQHGKTALADDIQKLKEQNQTLQQQLDKLNAKSRVQQIDKEMKTGVKPGTPIQSAVAASQAQNVPVQPTVDPALRAKALSPDVRAALAVFMEPRSIQPRRVSSGITYDKTFEKQPMSYSKLLDAGALEKSVDGLYTLGDIACGGGLDRLPPPKWSRSMRTAPSSWSEQQTSKVKKAQSMLIDYGPILVQEGLLSP